MVGRGPLSPEEVWRAYDADEARLSAPLSERMLDLAELRPGMRVLDLATGRGEPAIRAAHRVGPTGRVVGVDPSASMLRMARERADVEGAVALDLHALSAEAADTAPGGPYDVALTRWGLMYMDSPTRALAAAHRAVRPGGLLVAAVWAEPERVSYYTLPRAALSPPPPPPDPDAPGTFRCADAARFAATVAAAGWEVTHTEELEVEVMEARTDAALIAWVCAFGMQRLLADVPDAERARWEAEVIRAANAHRGLDGVVRLGGTTRILVARRGPEGGTPAL